MRTKLLLESLKRSSVRLLDLNSGELCNKEPLDILLDFLADETRKSGKPREHFERVMLSPENFNELSGDEKSTYTNLVKTILDKAFKN